MQKKMSEKFRGVFGKKNYKNQKGLGTIEMVVLVAILLTLALSFKTFATEYFNGKKDAINGINVQIQLQDNQLAEAITLDSITL